MSGFILSWSQGPRTTNWTRPGQYSEKHWTQSDWLKLVKQTDWEMMKPSHCNVHSAVLDLELYCSFYFLDKLQSDLCRRILCYVICKNMLSVGSAAHKTFTSTVVVYRTTITWTAGTGVFLLCRTFTSVKCLSSSSSDRDQWDCECVSLRWRCYEVHDIVIECSRVSLDPLESSCEEDFYSSLKDPPSSSSLRPAPLSSPLPHLDLTSSPQTVSSSGQWLKPTHTASRSSVISLCKRILGKLNHVFKWF